jgi:hypothetical protein
MGKKVAHPARSMNSSQRVIAAILAPDYDGPLNDRQARISNPEYQNAQFENRFCGGDKRPFWQIPRVRSE